MKGLIYAKKDCVIFGILIPHRSALELDRVLSERLISVLPKALIITREMRILKL